MKRWLTKLVVFLLLGAITTIAVAWGCAFWTDVYDGSLTRVIQPSESDAYEWYFDVRRQPGSASINLWCILLVKVGSDEVAPAIPTTVPPGFPTWNQGWPHESQVSWFGSQKVRAQEARGWPWLAMWCEHFTYFEQTAEELRSNPAFMTYKSLPYRGLALKPIARPIRPAITRVFPLGIIWTGFASCTVLYASAWFILLHMPFMFTNLRQQIRRKRGHCIKCGYDLRGHSGGGDFSAGCPECGWNREPLDAG